MFRLMPKEEEEEPMPTIYTPYVIERFLNGTAAELVPGIATKGQGGNGVVGSNPPKNSSIDVSLATRLTAAALSPDSMTVCSPIIRPR